MASVTYLPPPEYVWMSERSSVAPDNPQLPSLVAELGRQVEQQLANPTGSRVMVANLEVGHGDLVNDEAAKAQIGQAADQLHTAAHGE